MSSEIEDLKPEPARPPRVLAGAVAVAVLVVLALIVVLVHPRRRATEAAQAPETPATVTQDQAELRSDPAARAPVLRRLAAGERVTVLADQGRWLKVRTDSKTEGFVLEEGVETDSDREARQKRASKVLAFPAVFGVVGEDTGVLLAPFPLAAHAGTLHRGETIAIHSVDHDYYAFESPGRGLAFVPSAAIDLVPPDPKRPAIVPDGGKTLTDLKVDNLSPSTTPEPSEEGLEIGEDGSVRSASEQEPAVLVSKVDPQYPEDARRAGVEGTVVLDITIDETGSVTDLQVLRGLPLGVSEAAVDAVSRWKYRPARSRIGAVTSHKTVRVVFQLGQ